MILEHDNYRNFLKCELADRITKNSSYSLRAFANHLGLSAATVSLVLAGKKNLSQESTFQVASKLQLGSVESEYFNLLVQLETTKNPELKEQIIERLSVMNPKKKRTDLSVDFFRVISDWYHYAILMLTEIKSFEFSPANISKRLGINRFESEAAMERLQKLELLEKDPKNPKRYRRVKGDIVYRPDESNQALKKYNKQILEKAIESLETQNAQEKVIGSEVIAISQSQLKEARHIMEEFFAKMLTLAKNTDKKTDVYCVGVQIFNLSKPRSEK